MKFPKEARIGLLVVIAIFVLFAGFYFLRGTSLFSKETNYYVYYDNVSGLQKSSVVQLMGMQIGKVADIQLDGKDKIKVSLAINKKYTIPKGSVATLISLDMLGTKGISLDFGPGPNALDENGVLESGVESGLLDKLSTEVTPLLGDVRKVVNTVDSVLNSVNAILSPKAREDLQQSITALHSTMDNFATLSASLSKQSNTISKVIKNADDITSNLTQNNQNITQTLQNLKNTTDKLSQARIQETVDELEKMAKELNAVMKKVNNGAGSVGMAVNDKQLYNEINSTLKSLTELAGDLKAHPSRYINVTIFGRKAKTAQ